MLIIPSILVNSEQEFIKEINSVQEELDLAQVDIADGKFVPAKTWAEPEAVEKYCFIDVELHLMVDDPLTELQKWTATEVVSRVLIHLESPKNVKAAIEFAKENGWQVCLVINPDTEIEKLQKYLDKIDGVAFMAVYPGRQGQKLIPEVLEKIKQFTDMNPTIFTEIDGGVNEETLPDIIASGVKAICPGSAIFKNDRDPKENLENIEKILKKYNNIKYK